MDLEVGRALWEGTEEDVWEKMFSSERIAYYKNYQMTEMDQRFGDIYGDICGETLSQNLAMLYSPKTDREIEIIYELAQRVLEFEDMLSATSDLCGELDW